MFEFRKTAESDLALIQSWQNDHEVRRWIYVDDWQEYFNAVSGNPDYCLYTVLFNGTPTAQIAAERIGGELSLMLIVDPKRRGMGIGSEVLRKIFSCADTLFGDISYFAAYIHPNNTVSIKCFEHAWFEKCGIDPDGELIYRRFVHNPT